MHTGGRGCTCKGNIVFSALYFTVFLSLKGFDSWNPYNKKSYQHPRKVVPRHRLRDGYRDSGGGGWRRIGGRLFTSKRRGVLLFMGKLRLQGVHRITRQWYLEKQQS